MQLEQKVDRLESEMQRMNTDISETAIRSICKRINDHTNLFLPNLYKKLEALKTQDDELYKQMMNGFNNSRGPGLDPAEEMKQFKFLYNALKIDIDLLKATMTPTKVKLIDENSIKVKDLE